MTESEYWDLKAKHAQEEHVAAARALAGWQAYWLAVRQQATETITDRAKLEALGAAAYAKAGRVKLAEALCDFETKYPSRDWGDVIEGDKDGE